MPRPNRHTLLPFLAWLPRQTRASVGRDAMVGLSGAVLALPQSIAYALIAGLPPEYGLYAAIVPVLIACLWGSSWHLICGPTAAISIVLYASVSPLAVPGSKDYITLILLLTVLAGVFQWLLGLLRFGALVNFVSHSVVLGFTLGAAVVIALGQLPNLLGLDLPSQATAIKSLLALIDHAGEWDHASLALGLGTLLVGALLKYRVPRWPTRPRSRGRECPRSARRGAGSRPARSPSSAPVAMRSSDPPGWTSSAGWKMRRTPPGSSPSSARAASTSPAPSTTVVWTS